VELVETHTVDLNGTSYTFNRFYDHGDVVFQYGGDEGIEIRVGETFSGFVDKYSFDGLLKTVAEIIEAEVD
jgi:hypothetical protein